MAAMNIYKHPLIAAMNIYKHPLMAAMNIYKHPLMAAMNIYKQYLNTSSSAKSLRMKTTNTKPPQAEFKAPIKHRILRRMCV